MEKFISITDKLNNIKLTCKTHNSEGGGLCNEFTCHNESQLLCIKCISDPKVCIKRDKHSFVTYKEYIDTFYNEMEKLKSDYVLSNGINDVLNYLKNQEENFQMFKEKQQKVYDTIESIYLSLIDQIKEHHVQFKETFNSIMTEKENSFKTSMANLDMLTNYSSLQGFDLSKLTERLTKLPLDYFNNTILATKHAIVNLKARSHKQDQEVIASFTNLDFDGTIDSFQAEFDKLAEEIRVKNNILISNITKGLEGKEVKKDFLIGECKIKNDFPIDYSVNSNILEKKFCLFSHSSGKTLMAYPTSQHTIKLENFDQILTEDFTEHTSNATFKNNPSMNLGARDKYLYFKLSSHGAKINDILYYRHKDTDLLISTSDDKSIKIWDITHLEKYLDNINEYYKQSCIRTLLGHQGKIVCCRIFNDVISHTNLLVSVGLSDRVKIWDLEKGSHIRDINDNKLNMVQCFHHNSRNFLLGCGFNSNCVKLFCLDKGNLLKNVNYPFPSKVIQLLSYEESVLFIDENSQCALISYQSLCDEDGTKPEFIGMKLDNHKTLRTDAMIIQSYLIISCSNGCVYQYDLNERKFISNLRLSSKSISHIINYHHHTYEDMILVHSTDQHMRIITVTI